jgi:hypothetical protein
MIDFGQRYRNQDASQLQLSQYSSNQAGQSLIETIGAIFVLTMALTTTLGVAIYAFSRVNVSQKQVVAINLASEGIDVLRMVRDTNWLEGDAYAGKNTDLYNLDADCGNSDEGGPKGQDNSAENLMDIKQCYPSWLQGPADLPFHNYTISLGNSGDYRILFDQPSRTWTLDRRDKTETFNLCFDANSGAYRYAGTWDVLACDTNTNPPFARRVRVSQASVSNPYTPLHPLLLVTSAVVWSDRNCPPIANVDPITFSTPCKAIAEEYLSNWKDYK